MELGHGDGANRETEPTGLVAQTEGSALQNPSARETSCSLTNGVVFKKDWADAYAALHLTPSNGQVAGFWTSVDLLSGVLIAFLYAAMRPRLGAGSKTGVIAASMIWLPLHLALWSHLIDGVFPARALLGASALELVSASIGGVVVAKLYAERSEA